LHAESIIESGKLLLSTSIKKIIHAVVAWLVVDEFMDQYMGIDGIQ